MYAREEQAVDGPDDHIAGIAGADATKIMLTTQAGRASNGRNAQRIVCSHSGFAWQEIAGDVPEGEHLIPFGKAVVRHEGTDVTLVAYGRAVQYALDASGELASDGIRAEVIDLRTIVPLDLETVLQSVAKTTMAAVVHETHRSYGPGAEIAQRITEAAWGELAAPVKRIGGLDIPVPYSESLESVWLPTGAAVAAELRAWL